jgi:signal transduction histidine kinase
MWPMWLWPLLVVVASTLFCLVALQLERTRAQLAAARTSERLAIERRDRFLYEMASELEQPLGRLYEEVQRRFGDGDLSRTVFELMSSVRELAQLPKTANATSREPVDLAQLVRKILDEPPFSDEGPSVLLRAAPAEVLGDAERLDTGLRLLLWSCRRDAPEGVPMSIVVSTDGDTALVEVSAAGGSNAREVLAALPVIDYGLSVNVPRDSALSLRVAVAVARAHGGSVRGAVRTGGGQRLLLSLPRVQRQELSFGGQSSKPDVSTGA